MPKKTVLVAEDDKDIQSSLKEALELEGFRVYLASNGTDAMKVLEQIHEACLILLDLKMPEMTGFDFLKAIRDGSSHFVQIPVVAITGMSQTEVPQGAIGMIKKPFDLDELFRVIKNHCQPEAA